MSEEFKPDLKMIELLVCPVTLGSLEYNIKKQELISQKAQLAYPIKNGIPILLRERARSLKN